MADANANGKAFGRHTGIVLPFSQIAHVCEKEVRCLYVNYAQFCFSIALFF